MEGAAYFSMGVLLDNMEQYSKALDCYKKFVAVCQKLGDVSGEALAYNCIGVDFQHMAAQPTGMPYDGASSVSTSSLSNTPDLAPVFRRIRWSK